MIGVDPAAIRRIQEATFKYHWRGLRLIKSPFEMALYPLLLWKVKPRTVIELGSHKGGSAVWLADLIEAFGIDGHVHSIDRVAPPTLHPRVTFHTGEAQRPLPDATLAELPRPWLVIEDSEHTYGACIAVLEFFDAWLEAGEYIVIEDGIVTDLDQSAALQGGPMQAIADFLAKHADYQVDRTLCDFFGPNVTWNPNGYLQRTAKGKA